MPNTKMAFRAGELRKAFRISLTDCYAIAAAEHLNAKALFLKPEKRWSPRSTYSGIYQSHS
jgi:hypothetical protein